MRNCAASIEQWRYAHAAFTALPYAVFVECNGALSYSNQHAKKLLGITHAAASGQAAFPIVESIAAVLRNSSAGDGSPHAEICLHQKNYQVIGTPLTQSGDGSGARLVCLTEVRESRLMRSRRALLHMAHDLRNPLTTMQALLKQHDPETGGDQAKLMSRLRKQADYGLRVTQNFMQMSHAEFIDLSTFTSIDIQDLVQEAFDCMWLAAEEKGICLSAPAANPAVHALVRGNADMLMRVMINLLDNAIKFSPPNATVKVTVEPCGAILAINVIDQGSGIPADALSHIFDPFFQGKNKHKHGGSGLGLAFVKTVVECHGGQASIASPSHGGVHARITLPALATHA